MGTEYQGGVGQREREGANGREQGGGETPVCILGEDDGRVGVKRYFSSGGKEAGACGGLQSRGDCAHHLGEDRQRCSRESLDV